MKSVLAVLILTCTMQAYNPYMYHNRKGKLIILTRTEKARSPVPDTKTPCKPVTKTIIETNKAPLFNIPISQAVLVGNTTLHLSGQLGIDPVTLQLVPGGIIPETRQIFRNIAAVIEAAGGRLKDVFPQDFPARAVIQVVAVPFTYVHKFSVDKLRSIMYVTIKKMNKSSERLKHCTFN
ncbi:RIDA [Mytilus edulis]|uniref:RidA n=1 Tax=Mytilus edulis TaxID=6550 RepID=A0A8S3RB85_MYTED|nr:RIDA [Mytilus edulis]